MDKRRIDKPIQSARDTRDRRPYFQRAIEAHVPRKFCRDLLNRVRFGAGSPKSDMAIYVRPRDVTQVYAPQNPRTRLGRKQSGMVLSGNWDSQRYSIDDNTKFISCRMHWVKGRDWESTPIFERLCREIEAGLTPDGCRTIEDLRARYAALDQIFEETRRLGRLLNMRELPAFFRREHGAVLLHIGHDGALLRAGGGAHRFAIARILDLPEMPAQMGVIHKDALKSGVLDKLRLPSDRLST